MENKNLKKYEFSDLLNQNPPAEKEKHFSALNKFLDDEMERLRIEREGAMTEKGYAEFLSLEIGETRLMLMPSVPRIVEGGFGDRRAFRVVLGSTEYDWTVNPRSPLYHQLLVLLRRAPVEVTIIRIGEGKNTRYDLKK